MLISFGVTHSSDVEPILRQLDILQRLLDLVSTKLTQVKDRLDTDGTLEARDARI